MYVCIFLENMQISVCLFVCCFEEKTFYDRKHTCGATYNTNLCLLHYVLRGIDNTTLCNYL